MVWAPSRQRSPLKEGGSPRGRRGAGAALVGLGRAGVLRLPAYPRLPSSASRRPATTALRRLAPSRLASPPATLPRSPAPGRRARPAPPRARTHAPHTNTRARVPHTRECGSARCDPASLPYNLGTGAAQFGHFSLIELRSGRRSQRLRDSASMQQRWAPKGAGGPLTPETEDNCLTSQTEYPLGISTSQPKSRLPEYPDQIGEKNAN